MMSFQEPTTEQEHDDTTTCHDCISVKRRSPSSLLPVQRNPKREKPFHPSSRGYTKLPLHPFTLSPSARLTATAIPPLRRCTSDPVQFVAENRVQSIASADVATPEKDLTGSGRRKLCRSISAPEKDFIDESPNSKRLKRMKEQMREISKWCDKVIAEGDEEGEDDGRVDHPVGTEVFDNEALKGDDNTVRESAEEAVSVEKNGDSLIIHVKCPCSKAYQFLLSGKNCYYKIM